MKTKLHSSIFYFLIILIGCHQPNDDNEIKNSSENSQAFSKTLFAIAYSYSEKNQKDSAYFYYKKSLSIYKHLKDSVGIANNLINISILQSEIGNYNESKNTALEALKHLAKNKNKPLIYNTIAINHRESKEDHEAIYWYNKAINYSIDFHSRAMFKNNLAISYLHLKNFTKTISILDSLNKKIELNTFPKLKAKVTDNLAFTKWKQNSKYNPTPELKKALKIRLKENDLWGQNASYAHFSDYYRKTNPKKSLFYANKMYEIAKKLNSPDDQLEAIQKLIALETPEKSKFFFNRYVNLNDSIQNVRRQTKNKFALIKYDTEKNRSDNLKLKADNAEKDLLVFRSRVWLFVLGSLMLLGVISSYLGYLFFKRKAKQKEIESVHNTELRLAKKVHDSVANKAHQLLVETDHLISNPTEKESIKGKLIHLYELSRNISRETYDFDTNENFSHDLIEMLLSYETEDIKVLTNPIPSEFWEEIASHKKIVCYRVLQELMTNMRKHSQANYVEITISKKKNNLVVDYFDDGIGLHATKLKYKNGLRNTETRIKDIQGKIKFEQDLKEEGTHISFNFPIK